MMPPIPAPKGNLEELFRHHLLHSEEAAVPPLPHVWEQLDNSLLLAQNQRYRRRLLAYNWAMAASLLLTALVGAGWWQSQHHAPAAPNLAATTAPAAPAASPRATDFSAASHNANSAQTRTLAPAASLIQAANAPARYGASWHQHPQQASLFAGAAMPPPSATTASLLLRAAPAEDAATTLAFSTTTPLAEQEAYATAWGLGYSPLQLRLAALQLPAATSLPTHLTAQTTTPVGTSAGSRPWKLQVAYAGSVFNPNIDFARQPNYYATTLGPSAMYANQAAAEYRHHLRPGQGQRLSVWATRRLGIGRWSLRSGLEVAQNTAHSATSVGFVGQPLAAFAPTAQMQNTTYRYRSASVPVEALYTSAGRRGVSLYGRVGALVSTLFQVRSEVAGNAEATHTYTLQSADSPYRHVNASVRGGMGVRIEPAGRQWALQIGPVAEAGVLSLNNDPDQHFWSQQRPYSVGLEAGLEFSAPTKAAAGPAL